MPHPKDQTPKDQTPKDQTPSDQTTKTRSNGFFDAISRDLGAAFLLLSRIPVFWVNFDASNPPDTKRSLWAFPIVGIIAGLIAGSFILAANDLGLAPLITATIGVAVMTIFTGAMHEDGIADTADGFGGGNTPERKSEIMHDSRIGSYGVMALTLSTVARIAIIASLMDVFSGWGLVLIISAIAASARFQVLVLLRLFSLSQHARLGSVTGRPSLVQMAIGFIVWADLIWLLTSPTTVISVIIIASLATIWLGRLATRQIGGITGDVMGASIIIGEIALGITVIATSTPL